MSNFQFLQEEWSSLYRKVILAEQRVFTEPVSSASYCRIVLEECMHLIYDLEQHNKTVTIPSLTKYTLLKINIPTPPIALQTQFAERVTMIEEQKAIAQASLEKSEELFNSLLQKAFKGELV